MALHDRVPYPGITEPTYKQVTDLGLASTRYSREIFNDVGDELVDSIVSGSHAYRACINNILIPETRGLLDSVNYAELSLGAKRNMGTVPAQNMNKTVKTGTLRLGDRVCTVDKINPTAMLKSAFQQSETSTDTFDLLNKYPAGAPLTKAEIDALKKNKLRPCISFHNNTNGKVDSVYFSDGALCTGYIHLLDDALQQFKNYFSALIGKRFTPNLGARSCEFYPRRIVYIPSRLVKSCLNPIITEAAQIALECDVTLDGVKSKGYLYLSNPALYGNRNTGSYTPDEVVFNSMIGLCLRDYYYMVFYNQKVSHKDLASLVFIIGCYFFDESLEAQDK